MNKLYKLYDQGTYVNFFALVDETGKIIDTVAYHYLIGFSTTEVLHSLDINDHQVKLLCKVPKHFTGVSESLNILVQMFPDNVGSIYEFPVNLLSNNVYRNLYKIAEEIENRNNGTNHYMTSLARRSYFEDNLERLVLCMISGEISKESFICLRPMGHLNELLIHLNIAAKLKYITRTTLKRVIDTYFIPVYRMEILGRCSTKVSVKKNCGDNNRTIYRSGDYVQLGCFSGTKQEAKNAIDESYDGDEAQAYKDALDKTGNELTVYYKGYESYGDFVISHQSMMDAYSYTYFFKLLIEDKTITTMNISGYNMIFTDILAALGILDTSICFTTEQNEFFYLVRECPQIFESLSVVDQDKIIDYWVGQEFNYIPYGKNSENRNAYRIISAIMQLQAKKLK